MIRNIRRNLRNRRFRSFGQSLGLCPEDVGTMIHLGYSAWVESYDDQMNVIIYGADGLSRIMVLPVRNYFQASAWTVEFNRRSGWKIEEGEAS